MIYPDISLRDIERFARFDFLPFDPATGSINVQYNFSYDDFDKKYEKLLSNRWPFFEERVAYGQKKFNARKIKPMTLRISRVRSSYDRYEESFNEYPLTPSLRGCNNTLKHVNEERQIALD